ncbi:vascular endothelial growth factor receptor 1-like [Watersipora subatra]|uniref:vascular endothelial growth factor receptor 1-like n=1 Tax=Watersipora subatra TaxID=2589382 RepID=UPI00355BD12D
MTLQYAIVNKTLGVKIVEPFDKEEVFSCTFEQDGRLEELTGLILVRINIYNLPPPSLEIAGSKQHYISGESLFLTCTIRYEYVKSIRLEYPALTCPTCQKENHVVEATPTRVDYGQFVASLKIQELNTWDTGDYNCSYQVYSDTIYREWTSKEIYVYEEEFVECKIENSQINVTEGDSSVLLRVNVSALPTPGLSWMFGSTPLATDEPEKYKENIWYMDGISYIATLEIRALSRHDNGVYTLTSSRVNFPCSIQLNVHVVPVIDLSYHYKNKKTVFDSSSEVYVKPGEQVVIECTAKGNPRPNISYAWKQCNSPRCAAADSVWTDLPASVLQPLVGTVNQPYISATTPSSQHLYLETEESAWYRCESANVAGSTIQELHLVVSELNETSQGVGFSEDTLKHAKGLVEGDKLSLECRVARFECAETDVQIVESVKNKVIAYDMNSPMSSWNVNNNEYILTIELSQVSLAMNGDIYVCRCNDGKSGESLVIKSQEYTPPRWAKSMSTDQTVEQGVTKSFVCMPSGNPLPEISWYKDNQLLSPSSTKIFSDDNYTLTIVRAGADDSGLYKCVGKTNRLSIYSSFQLTVAGSGLKLTYKHIAIIVASVLTLSLFAALAGATFVRIYCRKKYLPHELLLPSKETLNPNIPIDEQTDALSYDVGWEFPIGNLKLGMLLGQGEFGRVLKAEAHRIEEGVTNTTVAVKTVRDQHDVNQLKALISELKILIHIGKHLNIVNLLGACTRNICKGHLLVIVEYCCNGNLRAYILQCQAEDNAELYKKLLSRDQEYRYDEELLKQDLENKLITQTDLINWSYQIARGMEYLASIDYIHRDLAARNVLLAKNNIVKICDFGLSKDIYKYKEYQRQSEGPLPIKWMALESLTHKVFNVKTDVWAYGVTVWELFSLAATPYPGWDIDDTFIDKLKKGYRMERPDLCPLRIYNVAMARSWSSDPEQRPSFTEVAELLESMLARDLVEHLHTQEQKYRKNHTSSRKHHDSGIHTDDVFVEMSYLQPHSPRQPKYYNMLGTEYDSMLQEKDVDMPMMLAPPVPGHHSIDSALPSTSSSSSTSSTNHRPPSYTYVMHSQHALAASVSMHVNDRKTGFSLDSVYV